MLAGAFIFGLIVVLWIARPPAEKNASQNSSLTAVVNTSSTLTAEETTFDFGSISMGKGEVTHDFTVTNEGEKTITITKLSTSCMCTRATLITPREEKGPFGMEGHGGLHKRKGRHRMHEMVQVDWCHMALELASKALDIAAITLKRPHHRLVTILGKLHCQCHAITI